MKTRIWILLLTLMLVLSVGLSLWLLWPRTDASFVEVWSDGELLCQLDLRVDRQITVEGKNGTNIVTVKDGKVAVTEADCPDRYCMDRGFCAGGAQIVCLPNRLVIRFTAGQEMDGMTG